MFAPEDLDKFADWCKEEARLARTNIVTATELPPGLLPPGGNGRPPRG
jgi:hypothetical protein